MQLENIEAVLNSIPSQIAVLDAAGRIVQVNEAWSTFARDNGGSEADGVGSSYLEVCRSAREPWADEALFAHNGIRTVLRGTSAKFDLEYPCHSPTEKRWFLMTVLPFKGTLGGAVVSHVDITQLKLAENRRAGFDRILEQSLNEIYIYDAATLRFIEVNEGACRNLGYTLDELQSMTPVDIKPEHTEDTFAALVSPLLNGNKDKIVFTTVHQRKDGSDYPVEVHLQRMMFDDRQVYAAIILDITQRRQAEEALFQEKERAQVTLESIGDGVITTDAQGRVNYCNAVAEALTGWCRDEALGQPLTSVFNVVDEETRERVADPIARCLIEDRVIGLTKHTLLLNRHGREYAIQDSAAPIYDRQGELLGTVLVFSDVSEQRRLNREISHQASHDELTGLVNRREFEMRLQRVLETAHADHNEHALCFLDLDQFKVVNDTCGHAAGDVLLGQIAELFRGHIRERDTLGRLGGDEFGVLLEHCGIEQAKRVANALRSAADEYRFVWDGKPFRIGVCIGVVPITDESRSRETLMQAADSACYVAKDAGRNRIHVYHEHDVALARRHGEMQWVSRIQQALEDDGFQLYTQLIKPLDANVTTGLHCEVLLRMVDQAGRVILPGAFIPAAERYDLAVRIDRWVIEHTFRWLAEQPTVIDSLELCAINLSGHSLSDRLFEVHVLRQLAATGIPGEKICFEITETAAIANLNDATRFITTLKAHGCRFALDDFGSGLSSFAYLKNLPVDFLKIDGMFVKDMVDDPIDHAMVRSINEIGQLMGKQTIAEYAENEAILNQLGELGVNFAQGYGVSRPLPIARLLKETWRYSQVEGSSRALVE